MSKNRNTTTRRGFLKGAGAAAAASTLPLGTYLPRAWAATPIKVSAYGGYFEDNLVEFAYPEFTAATGIEVQSVSQAGDFGWFTRMESAIKAGNPPVDVTMIDGNSIRRAKHLFQPIDEAKSPNIANAPDYLVFRDAGRVIGAPVLAWYTNFVTNTETWPEPPTSWAAAWDAKYAGQLGCPRDADTNYLIDIVAHTFFGGTDIMATREGRMQCLKKAAELKPNVALWYRDEGQFQSMLQSGELTGGMYYHDVTMVMRGDGFPVRSTFPKEGGVIDFGSWSIVTTDKTDACNAFINWCLSPEAQTTITRNLWTAPVLPRTMLPDLTEEEFSRTSSEIPPIVIDYDIYVKDGDWITETWEAMLTGAVG